MVTFRQKVPNPLSDLASPTTEVTRRALVYAPVHLPAGPVPVILVFPGYSASAESMAFYTTHTRFEALADRDGFIVVYGNGLPTPPNPQERPSVPAGGFLQGCLAPHGNEGIDVSYVRQLLDSLDAELPIDRRRIYATGHSAGGGMAFQLALEAPDLVAAIAPVTPLPFQPTGIWRLQCHPHPGYERVSIAMVAGTADPFISFSGGRSREYPTADYPGMEQALDVWLNAVPGQLRSPTIDHLPDVAQDDSYQPDSGQTDSRIERRRWQAGSDGREVWYYKAIGMGHTWPNPTQLPSFLWPRFGKTNQDIDFADEAWAFFQRHVKR
ncbi:MAG: alpha/beta hydrolase family esterase [Polyangia bacterium]